MARSRSDNGVHRVPEGKDRRFDPPCMTAGEDPVLHQAVPWVKPDPTVSGSNWTTATDAEFQRDYPTLHAFLTMTGCEGKSRKAGSMSLFAQDGKWKACINDNDGGYLAFVSSDTVATLLGACERGLKQGQLDWRKMKWKR